MEQDRDSRNDIDGITLPMREEKLEMHLQTLLQQTSVAAAAVAAQSFAVPTARAWRLGMASEPACVGGDDTAHGHR